MQKKITIKVYLLLFAFIFTGCSSTITIPTQSVENYQSAKTKWRSVLKQHVDAKGLVDYQGVERNILVLEHWLNFVAKYGPNNEQEDGQFVTSKQRLSYYIDAYNALAMYGVLKSGVLPEDKIRFFILRKYPVMGESISLYHFENEIIRKEGDPRIHFALNCMSVGCPYLPAITWNADRLDQQLEQATVQFINDPRNVYLKKDMHEIWVSEIFDFYPEDFGDLIAYINQYRQEKVPVDFTVKFIPYDWLLNRQI